MSNQRFPMTKEGADKLREELHQLKTVDRPNVIKAIAEAREHGDLKENAEYDAAKDHQGQVEAKIRHLEDRLQRAQIIDVASLQNSDSVTFGATVTLIHMDNDSKLVVTIVGEYEADFSSGRISHRSPIAMACIAKKVGDIVVVKTPDGDQEYEIDCIEHITQNAS
ncbi:MAG: transcription elongation factor GreA [Candidatus Comchoanobacterales bacterium]